MSSGTQRPFLNQSTRRHRMTEHTEVSTKSKQYSLPEGRLINSSLFVKDAYNDQSQPRYKVELVFPKDSEAAQIVEDMLLDAVKDKWGEETEDHPDLQMSFLDGDRMAKEREEKGKAGEAYKGMYVVRADTSFNMYGDDATGGIAVYDQDVNPVDPANQSEVYNGCYGIAAVTTGCYEWVDPRTKKKNPGVKFYLSAFQKTRKGERLASSADKSTLFKPVGRENKAEQPEGRRRRR